MVHAVLQYCDILIGSTNAGIYVAVNYVLLTDWELMPGVGVCVSVCNMYV